MAYLDEDVLYNNVEEKYKSAKGKAREAYSDVLDTICEMPRADVVPKSEVDRLVDKWIGDEKLTQDEKTLRLIEALRDEAKRYERYYFNHEYDKLIAEAKAEVAREIFEEIEEGIKAAISALQFASAFHRGAKHEAYSSVMRFIKTVEKKYIPQCRTCKHMLSCEPNLLGICDEYEEGDKNGKENT